MGKRADKAKNPLFFYAHLELLVAAFSAVTPFLILFVRHAYAALGGSIVMGSHAATVVRLVFSAVVLFLPTFVMGGTFPAAVKAAESREDLSRRRLATAYGANTLGGAINGVPSLASGYSKILPS